MTLTSTDDGDITADTGQRRRGTNARHDGRHHLPWRRGGLTPLASLTTRGGGTTDVDGGGVTTTATQDYDEAVLLGADATFTSTGGGSLMFVGPVNGAAGLTLNTGGSINLLGPVGGNTPLGDLMTEGGGATEIYGGGVTTVGAQDYSEAVTIGTPPLSRAPATATSRSPARSTARGADAQYGRRHQLPRPGGGVTPLAA